MPPLDPRKPPSHLDRGAKAEWRRLLPVLEARGDFDLALGLLELYCAAVSEYRAAEKGLRKTGGAVLESKNSKNATYIQQNPWCAIRNKAREQMRLLAKELGLTPQVGSKKAGGAGKRGRDPGDAQAAMAARRAALAG